MNRAHRIELLAALAASCFLLLAIGAGKADAYSFNGCRWSTADRPSITYRENSLSTASTGWDAAVAQGQYNWDAYTGTGTTYWALTTSSSPNVNVHDAYYTDSWWGLTSYSCSSNDFNSPVTMRFNMNSPSGGFSSTQKAKVAVHEFGHAYGLTHVDRDCASTDPAIMRGNAGVYCSNWGQGPLKDDREGWSARY